jgi:predicted CXXCH cytochrome family protein
MYLLLFFAAMVLISGCEANTRYQVLSYFFDGVPLPAGMAAQTGNPKDQAAGKAAAGLSAHPSRHGPFDAKMCDACHDKNTNKLLLPKEELCLKCHTFPSPRRQHGPVVSGGCLVCHDPHSSSNQYLLVAEAKDFCMYCHEKNDIFSHEAHRSSDTACTVCHNAHGSDNDFLLR